MKKNILSKNDPVALYQDTYKVNASETDLVLEYAPLVKRIAYHLITRLPPNVLVDDLVQAGMIGLLEVINKYDGSKGASFETYATIRIRGSMLDEIRKGDWVPRSVHRNGRNISEAISEVEKRKGNEANDTDVAKQLGVTLEKYHKMLKDVNHSRLIDFDEYAFSSETFSKGLGEQVEEPQKAVEREEFQNIFTAEIKKLPEREQLILSLYYDEELNLKEIGQILGVSEARVCQIHSQAMLRMQSRLKEWKEEVEHLT